MCSVRTRVRECHVFKINQIHCSCQVPALAHYHFPLPYFPPAHYYHFPLPHVPPGPPLLSDGSELDGSQSDCSESLLSSTSVEDARRVLQKPWYSGGMKSERNQPSLHRLRGQWCTASAVVSSLSLVVYPYLFASDSRSKGVQ